MSFPNTMSLVNTKEHASKTEFFYFHKRGSGTKSQNPVLNTVWLYKVTKVAPPKIFNQKYFYSCASNEEQFMLTLQQ